MSSSGPYLKAPKPEDPCLEPPAELLPMLDILNHALLEPFGIEQGVDSPDDLELFISRLRRARSWRLSLDPEHPVRDLCFRRSPEDPGRVWITRDNCLLAEELAEQKALLLNGKAEDEPDGTS